MTPSELLQIEFAELRLRRDTEEKLVRLWVAICSTVLAAAFGFSQWAVEKDIKVYFLGLFLLLTSGFLAGIGMRIAKKIDEENTVYAGIGRTIKRLIALDYSISEDASKGRCIGEDIGKIGQGTGHKHTSEIIRFSAGFTGFSLFVFSIVLFITEYQK